jgi:hypothetical protein
MEVGELARVRASGGLPWGAGLSVPSAPRRAGLCPSIGVGLCAAPSYIETLKDAPVVTSGLLETIHVKNDGFDYIRTLSHLTPDGGPQ